MRLKILDFMSFFSLIKFACILSFFGYVHCSGIECRVKAIFIYRDYDSHTYSAEHLHKILENKNFYKNKTTAILSFGFLQTPLVPSVRSVVDAYLQNGNYNFMIISCDDIISYNVFTMDQVADDMSDGLLKIISTGYNKFHLIGFSLGAQVAGVIGRMIMSKSKGKHKISRITGLDPGQVLPLLMIDLKNLNKEDAKFVDIIHSESRYFGSTEAIGHANFWINGGKSQPMCKSEIQLFVAACSHLMALTYWAESVHSDSPNNFNSLKCINHHHFLNHTCGKSIITSMGLSVSLKAEGSYYLETNLDPPYSKN